MNESIIKIIAKVAKVSENKITVDANKNVTIAAVLPRESESSMYREIGRQLDKNNISVRSVRSATEW